jgi:hypothetical protein
MVRSSLNIGLYAHARFEITNLEHGQIILWICDFMAIIVSVPG